MQIKDIRLSKGLTQIEASKIVGLSLRTYQNYEGGFSSRDTFKINNIIRILNEYEQYSENKGIYTKKKIKELAQPIFEKYGISYAYLFGSYVKDKANEKSDIDILVSGEAKGFKFLQLQSDLIDTFKKQIDLIRSSDLKNNEEFLNEILETGEKIYGKK